MKEVILIKIGEIVLKGLNRKNFEDRLIRTIRERILPLGNFEIINLQSTIYLIPQDESVDLESVCKKVSKIFGISCFSRAAQCEKNIDSIRETAAHYLREELSQVKTFKIESKRSDKKFSLKSPEISALVGEHILEAFTSLSVDVNSPDITVTVEVRDFGAYVRGEAIPGAGGIPVGTGGRAAILISGGIDSPVAAWMMAKRGVELVAVHFASPPYTSPRAEQKVVSLLNKVAQYSGKIEMLTVPFTQMQELIKKSCPEDLFTIIMRRFMMKISQRIAQKYRCGALVTGESLGQVASQTMSAISCTDAASDMPIFRPLIGMDKDEIVTIARKIDTFETSILPYEDCCTVFTPRHPKTRPTLEEVLRAEEKLDCDSLIETALANLKVTKIL